MNYTEAKALITSCEQDYRRSFDYRIEIFKNALSRTEETASMGIDVIDVSSKAIMIASTERMLRMRKVENENIPAFDINHPEITDPSLDLFDIEILNKYHEFQSLGRLNWVEGCGQIIEIFTSNPLEESDGSLNANFISEDVRDFLNKNSLDAWYICEKPFNKMSAIYQLENGLFIRLDHSYYKIDDFSEDYLRSREMIYYENGHKIVMSIYSPNKNDPAKTKYQTPENQEFVPVVGQLLYDICPFGNHSGFAPKYYHFDVGYSGALMVQLDRVLKLESRI